MIRTAAQSRGFLVNIRLQLRKILHNKIEILACGTYSLLNIKQENLH